MLTAILLAPCSPRSDVTREARTSLRRWRFFHMSANRTILEAEDRSAPSVRQRIMEDSHSVPMTAEGIKKFQEELDYLVNVRRPEVARQIADAKADGDISENAGYDEAKNAQAFVEGRILTLKNLLSNAVIIKENGSKDRVDLGSTVTIQDVAYGDQETYTIVGPTEVDPGNGRISLRSPIGRALMGHSKGDSVQVQTPAGLAEFKVMHIG
jgi:transcription elongation factor GreA